MGNNGELVAPVELKDGVAGVSGDGEKGLEAAANACDGAISSWDAGINVPEIVASSVG